MYIKRQIFNKCNKGIGRSLVPATCSPQVFGNGMIIRGYQATKSGPPKYPLSTLDCVLLGGGFVFAICILPFWALRQVPKWSEIHNKTD